MSGLENFFKPGSVAIVGASGTPGKIGNAILTNMIECGYPGVIYPINPREDDILGLACHKSLLGLPETPDMAVIAVPAPGVLDILKQCGEKGVKNVVTITAGFKEVGKQGLEMEKDIISTCSRYGMRMLGPNCLGMIDTHLPLNTSFAKGNPLKGNIAFLSQSGAMLVAILDWSKTVGLGFSKVISLGNKAVLSEVDFIQEASEDPNTSVILCYIEDVSDGAKFLEVVSRATRKKPVIIFKSGTSQAGARAASSHTGALAGSDLAYDIAFKKCGVIRAKSMAELFDLAVAFTKLPLPAGDRVAVVTNSGGPGIIITDNIESQGLAMARFSKETLEALRSGLPAESGIYNPVDVLGDAKTDRYALALSKVCADPASDSVVMLMCPAAVAEPLETSRALVAMKNKYPQKPFFAVYMGGESLAEGAELLAQAGIPCYTFPEPSIASIREMVKYSRYINSDFTQEEIFCQDVDPKAVKAIFYDVMRDNRLTLLGSEAAEVARAYGVAAAPVVLAVNAAEAVEEAEKMGYPVVLKVASPKIMHKTDVGGVKIGLESAEEVKKAFLEIMESVHRHLPDAVVYGIEVQKMMPRGTEIILGMSRDVQFGPMIAFGLGGIYVNLLKDVSFRLARGLCPKEITSMIAETKASQLLRGYRGERPSDVPALLDAVGRMARLVLDFPEISEIDVNPVFAYQEGYSALDIKITISFS